MEHRGNITLVQWFGGIAWFSLAYGCNDNKEDNSCSKERNHYLPKGLNAFINAFLATLRGRGVLEHRASCFYYKEVSCKVCRCCFFMNSTFSVLFGFLIFWRPDCNFQRGVLKTFCSAVVLQFSVVNGQRTKDRRRVCYNLSRLLFAFKNLTVLYYLVFIFLLKANL